MPNNALTYNNTGTSTGSSGKGTIMKVNKATPKSNLKVGAGGSNTFSRQLDAPGKLGLEGEMFNHMNLENYHKIVTPTGVMPRA